MHDSWDDQTKSNLNTAPITQVFNLAESYYDTLDKTQLSSSAQFLQQRRLALLAEQSINDTIPCLLIQASANSSFFLNLTTISTAGLLI